MVATPLRRSQEAAESPLRAELYSADQMERHGEALARAHKLRRGRTRDLLLRRLAENEGVLVATGELLKTALTAGRAIAPAGEWLLDNFHLIEEQVRTAKRHLPKAYSRELPRLLHGPSQGLPRAYDIALEAIAHGDGRLDAESLRRFVAAYQTVAPLKLGELWAVPIMLRLALLENLRRVAARIAAGTAERDLAGAWADRMIEIAGRDAKSLILATADMARSNPPMTSSFVAELARRLQGQGAALALPLTWIEQRLSELDLTIEQLVQSQTREQAADQVSMANSIGSLRLLGATDWREFVEAMSVVERSLREDRVYGAMDFATRDRYRHAVEKIAKASPLSEGDVAREAMRLAHAAAAHVGFYLIDKGLPELERAAQARVSVLDAARRTSRRMALPAVPRRDRAGHRDHQRWPGDGLCRWRARVDAGSDRPRLGACREPARGCAREPPRHGARVARTAAADRFLRRDSAAIAHPCRGSGHADAVLHTSSAWWRHSKCVSSRTGTTTCTTRC